jgi:hypothetical protein
LPVSVHEPATHLPVVGESDLVVVGGSLAGFAAAARACANGLSAVIIEERGSLGREAWASLQLFPRPCEGCDLPPVGLEIRERLGAVNAWSDRCFDAPALQVLLDKMAAERSITTYFQAHGEQVLCGDGGSLHVVMGNKSGRQAFRCRYVVDATENACMIASADPSALTDDPGDGVIRRAMLMVGAQLQHPERIAFNVPDTLGTTDGHVRARQSLWPGDAVVWADFGDIAGPDDWIERETFRRMTQVAALLHETSSEFHGSSLMFVAHDPLWLRGRVLSGAVSPTLALPFALKAGTVRVVPMPEAWLDPHAAGDIVACGPYLRDDALSAADYADFGNALRLGDACAMKLL